MIGGFIKYIIFIYPYLKRKSGIKNIVYSKTWRGKNNIKIGRNNYFELQSKLSAKYKNESIQIGNNNKFSFNSFLNAHNGRIIIHNNIFIGPNTIIQGFGGVEIKNNVLIAGNTFISSSDHNFENPKNDEYLLNEKPAKVHIEENVWIGANSVITKGLTIGHHSIVAAGSVVTRDVNNYTLVAGIPAKEIKKFNLKTLMWEKI